MQPVEGAAGFFGSWDFVNAQFLIVALLAAAYLVGVARLSTRSDGAALSRRRVLYGVSGFAVLVFSTAGPVEVFSGELFAAHMAQHILIAMVGAVLLLAAGPMPAYMWSLPAAVRLGAAGTLTERGWARRLLELVTRPRVTLPLFVLTIWAWHIPQAYDASLDNEGVHFLMHVTMLATAMLFWWPIIGPAPVRSRLGYPQRLLYLLLVVTPTALLAAIITLSNDVLFTHYLDAPGHFGITPQEDQRIGGLLMWIPGNVVYLSTITALFFMWFAEEERKSGAMPKMRRRDARNAEYEE